jgi:splicing factor 1
VLFNFDLRLRTTFFFQYCRKIELVAIQDPMAWRNRGITGTNNIPLGPRKRFGDAALDDSNNNISTSSSTPEFTNLPNVPVGPLKVEDRGRSRKRKSRWGDESARENKVLGLLGLPTAITAIMSPEQVEAYALQLRIEEITQKMKINDVVPAGRERSKSPAPTYDNMGRRTNTREVRYRKKLEDERHRLVEKAMKIIPEFKPPSDYRRLTRTQEKIYIPVNDVPLYALIVLTFSIRRLISVWTPLVIVLWFINLCSWSTHRSPW